MELGQLLVRARRAAGLSQADLASRAMTSRPTISASEHQRKSPTLEPAARLLAVTGHVLEATPQVDFAVVELPSGRLAMIPNRLPRLSVPQAVRTTVLPVHLHRSSVGRAFDLSDRADRALVYETVLREGLPADVVAYVDGALLIDLWHELVLPLELRRAWEPVIATEKAVARP